MHLSMQYTLLFIVSLSSVVLAQQCGPAAENFTCSPGVCCSQYGWCALDAAHCDPNTCLPQFSGTNSPCSINATTSTINTTTTSTSACYPSTVPDIDVCGLASSGISCPGAGANNFFYRCCSSAGHCGPKNNIQNQSLYCGDECQLGYGKCDTEVAPPDPTTAPGIAPDGEPCGPIVNKKCASGLCCSGSNYCGTGPDFCGSANWCQRKWGLCS